MEEVILKNEPFEHGLYYTHKLTLKALENLMLPQTLTLPQFSNLTKAYFTSPIAAILFITFQFLTQQDKKQSVFHLEPFQLKTSSSIYFYN